MPDNKISTFVDASVLIYAAKKPIAQTFELRSRALLLLEDPDREFVASEFLRLETLPLAKFFKRQREIRFYEEFFASVKKWSNSASLVEPAFEIACEITWTAGILPAMSAPREKCQ